MSRPILFLKSHVDGYTRRDGTYVKPHDDKRAAKEQSGDWRDEENWHSRTMARMKTLPPESLRYIIKDATEAAEAAEKMGGSKAGQYRDEAHYAAMELKKRQAAAVSGANPTRPAADKLGQVHYLAHPRKGYVPGKYVMVPHPEHPDKKVLGKYMGQHGGESVIQHEKLGALLTHNDHVHPARGVPKQDPRGMEREADAWHAAHAHRTEA